MEKVLNGYTHAKCAQQYKSTRLETTTQFGGSVLLLCEHQRTENTNKYNNMISDVRQKGSFIEVYDSNSKKVSYMSANRKELVGIASSFFVILHGTFIEVYDEKCKRISYMSQGKKTVSSAAGNTFTVKNGTFIEIYDAKCKRISYRSA